MLYKFKSKASGDVIMLGPNGDQVLRLFGREPAPRGIFEVEAMPGLIAQLRAAVIADEARRLTGNDDATAADAQPARRDDRVSLRQRVWPLLDMLQRCHSASEVIVWGA